MPSNPIINSWPMVLNDDQQRSAYFGGNILTDPYRPTQAQNPYCLVSKTCSSLQRAVRGFILVLRSRLCELVPHRHPMILIWPPASRECIREMKWTNSLIITITDYRIPTESSMNYNCAEGERRVKIVMPVLVVHKLRYLKYF